MVGPPPAILTPEPDQIGIVGRRGRRGLRQKEEGPLTRGVHVIEGRSLLLRRRRSRHITGQRVAVGGRSGVLPVGGRLLRRLWRFSGKGPIDAVSLSAPAAAVLLLLLLFVTVPS